MFEKFGVIGEKEKNEKDSNYKRIAKSEIISCSRRTDIPAFLMDWGMECIKQGFVDVKNPYSGSLSRVSLDPADCKVWVWWSKNFGPWISAYKNDEELFLQYKAHFFNFTINSPSELESCIKISLDERLKQAKWIAETFGIEFLQQRFDPIVFYKRFEDPNGSEDILNNLDKFEYIISKSSDFGLHNITISFATVYNKVQKRMLKREKIIVDPPLKDKLRILENLAIICKDHGVTMHLCCQPELIHSFESTDYNGMNIKSTSCIDGEKINKLVSGGITKIERDKGQRKECHCQKSRDIGGYDGIFQCHHNCDYCYANPTTS